MTNSISIQTNEKLNTGIAWLASKTFKRHLNIYLDIPCAFCLLVFEGRKTIFNRQIDFDLTMVERFPKKMGYKSIKHRLIFILYQRTNKHTHTHICILSQWTKQRITSTNYLSLLLYIECKFRVIEQMKGGSRRRRRERQLEQRPALYLLTSRNDYSNWYHSSAISECM